MVPTRAESVDKLLESLGFTRTELEEQHDKAEAFSDEKAALAWVIMEVFKDAN